MDNQESTNQNPSNKSQNFHEQPPLPPHHHNPVIITVILALIFGMLGGSLSTYYFLQNKTGQNGSIGNQKVTLNEDSAIIDVVKSASPAVVSIIVSQDLNKIPGYGLNPYNEDPFFFFFNGRGQPQYQPTPSEPNIQEVGAGSGFFVSADGLILTNKHVVSDTTATYKVITADGKSYDAQVLTRDPVNDLAIVKIEASGEPFLTMDDSSQIQIGQRVVAIGNSLGQYQNTVTSGIISGTLRSITAGDESGSASEQLSGVIQTDAAINPGNSGGPLLNIAGRVIGINTAIDQQGQLVGFAIPSNDAQKALQSFQKNGRITRVFLGVRYVPVTKALALEQKLGRDYGALILSGQTQSDLAIVPGSPADKAGLKANQIILQVNGQKIDDKHPLGQTLQNYNVGDVVTLRVYDKNAEKDVKVTLGETK